MEDNILCGRIRDHVIMCRCWCQVEVAAQADVAVAELAEVASTASPSETLSVSSVQMVTLQDRAECWALDSVEGIE